jgi:hypothetical protein
VSLSQGLGSSDLWLDRGRAGKARLAEFRRVGDRVLLVVRNKHFLTLGDPAAVRAGEESFALSVVWSGPVLREEDGLVTESLLDPARLNRLAWQHAADPAVPGVADLLTELLAATWRRDDPVPADVPAGTAVQHTADWTLLHEVLRTLDTDALHAPVRSELRSTLRELATDLRQKNGDHHHEAADFLTAYLTDPTSVRLDPPPRLPPGAPN